MLSNLKHLLSALIIGILFFILGCNHKIEVNVPFNFYQNNNSNIDFKIDTISNKEVYNILLSKSYIISMEENAFGFTKEIHEKPNINYNLIRKAIHMPKTEEINSKYNFYAIIKVNDSSFKKIPIKLSNITIID